jgi:hypothetical protein
VEASILEVFCLEDMEDHAQFIISSYLVGIEVSSISTSTSTCYFSGDGGVIAKTKGKATR